MSALVLSRFSLTISATALLAACGGSLPPIGPSGATADGGGSLLHHKTFRYSGKSEPFTVPSGITHITVDARGAQGGGSSGGFGGHVVALIPVIPGEKLRVFVGGQPTGISGGFNGGGSGGTPSGCKYYCGYGGGGASDVRDSTTDRLVAAGGGGGQGGNGYPGYAGGAGGLGGGRKAAAGESGVPYGGGGGFGGTQHHGGAGGPESYGSTGNGAPGSPGSFGTGGAGGQGCVPTGSRCGDSGANGGGGGGGYYGGGGGAAGPGTVYIVGGGGGGGGSSYIIRAAKNFINSRGWKRAIGNGLVIISWGQ